MKRYSLRHRLMLWISLPIMLATTLSFLLGFLFSWHEIEEVYDAQMAHTAKLLLQIAEYEVVEQKNEKINLGEESDLLRHKYENKMAFRIWRHDRLLTRSWNTDNFADIEAPPGFSDIDINGKPWRIFVFIEQTEGIKIEVAQRYAIRYELIGQLMSSLIAPALIFVPLILLIIWVGTRRATRPLIDISDDVNRRSSDDLSPIRSAQLPEEIAPLVLALNNLFIRISESFRREREFTDHAAHELRTPLAAMKTQTQVLIKKTSVMPECSDGLENLQSSIDRATHLVDQLLALARIQNDDMPLARTDLSECLQDIVAEYQGKAREKQISLTIDITEEIFVLAHADSLMIMLGNFVDNALKYTPERGQVFVSLTKNGLLEISDSGPGLNDEDKKRVFNRFVRVDKTGQSGSGLGLSIAQWIADAHKVKIILSDNLPQGLKLSIQWEIV